MLEITENESGYMVQFANRPQIKDAIKSIPGSRFIWSKKAWHVPKSSQENFQRLVNQFGSNVVEKKSDEIPTIEPLPDLDIEIPLLIDMFPYQKNGVAYILKHKRLIVGDQPGLGKTGQAIAAYIGGRFRCVLVICPSSLRLNWQREIKIWTNQSAVVLKDSIKQTWPQYHLVGMCNVFITNYESLKKYFVKNIRKVFDKNGKQVPLKVDHIEFHDTIKYFDSIIIDESHRCKDGKTQTSKFVIGIATGKEWVLALTGTPVVNKPIDLISQLYIINQMSHFGGYNGFLDKFCDGPSKASNLKLLNALLHKHCFYRREKKDVLKDLPAKIRSILKCDINTRMEYDKAESRLIDYLSENLGKSDGEINTALRGETMVLMGILKRISAFGKIDQVKDYVLEVTDAGEKIVLFAWHKEVVKKLKEAIPGCLTIVGDDSMEERQAAVDAFQNDPTKLVIILNIKSGGVGITLTASSRVGFVELPWHPADCEQCEDRCHRIGQRDSVDCKYFLGHNTIDEYIYEIIEKKRAIVNQVTGSEDQIETNVVDEFINLFMKQK